MTRIRDYLTSERRWYRSPEHLSLMFGMYGVGLSAAYFFTDYIVGAIVTGTIGAGFLGVVWAKLDDLRDARLNFRDFKDRADQSEKQDVESRVTELDRKVNQ